MQKATNLMYFVTFIYMCSYEIKQLAFEVWLVFFPSHIVSVLVGAGIQWNTVEKMKVIWETNVLVIKIMLYIVWNQNNLHWIQNISFFERESDVKAKYGDPYSELMLCIYPSKYTHTAVNTHTHTHTHTEQWAAIYAAAPGEQLGVQCLAQGHLVVVLKVERALYIPPTYNSCQPETRTHNLWIMSPTLTIRPRLP